MPINQFYDLWSRSKITGTFYWCLGGTFGFAGSLQSYGFAPLLSGNPKISPRYPQYKNTTYFFTTPLLK